MLFIILKKSSIENLILYYNKIKFAILISHFKSPSKLLIFTNFYSGIKRKI